MEGIFMFGIGVPELVLILIIGLVVFGPGKLPEIGKAVGRSLNEFKKATTDITSSTTETVIKTEATPPQKPVDAEIRTEAIVKPEEKKQ